MPRVFAAVELTDEVRETFVGAGSAFLELAPDWAGEKWVSPNSLHVTLVFLGDVPDGRLPHAVAALVATASAHTPFVLAADGVASVPGGARSRMLWGRLADPVGLAAGLAADVRASLAPWTAHSDAKPFRPHVTLVRARRPRVAPPDALAAANAHVSDAAASMSVGCVTLFASTLTRTGPIYEVLDRVPLGSA